MVRQNIKLPSHSLSNYFPPFEDFLYPHNVNSNKIIRSSWGNRSNFQKSYGLGAQDFGEGKEILKAMEKAEKGSAGKKEVNKK